MTDPLDDRLRALLAPSAPDTGTSADLHRDLVDRGGRRRRRRAVATTALGVALLGAGALVAPQLAPTSPPDSARVADDPGPTADRGPTAATRPTADPVRPVDPTAGPDATSGAAPSADPGVPPPDRLVASTAGGTHAVVVHDVTGEPEPIRVVSPADEDLILTGLSADGEFAYVQSLDVEGCGRYNALLPVDGSGRGGPLWHDDPGWPFAALSPDGTRIAALERPEAHPGDSPVCEGDGAWDLVVVDAATGERRRYADATLDGAVGIDLAWSPDNRHVAFLRYGVDRGVSGVLTVLDTQAPEASVVDAGEPAGSGCATRSPQWADSTRLVYLEVCPDGTNHLAAREAVGTAGADVVVERRALPPRDPATYGPQDLDLDTSGRYAVWAQDNRLYALDLAPVDAQVRDLGIEGVSPQW